MISIRATKPMERKSTPKRYLGLMHCHYLPQILKHAHSFTGLSHRFSDIFFQLGILRHEETLGRLGHSSPPGHAQCPRVQPVQSDGNACGQVPHDGRGGCTRGRDDPAHWRLSCISPPRLPPPTHFPGFFRENDEYFVLPNAIYVAIVLPELNV